MRKMLVVVGMVVGTMVSSMVSYANEYYSTTMIVKDVTNYGSVLEDSISEAWLDNVQLEVGSKYIVTMDSYDEIVGIVAVDQRQSPIVARRTRQVFC